MKKAKRHGYLILADLEPDMKVPRTTSLCAWCRYADWSGACEDCELHCQHPIDRVSDNCWNAWQGGDCWGFRPKVSREDAVDICGLGLQGKWPDWDSIPKIGGRHDRR